jgi:hypothetical protein
MVVRLPRLTAPSATFLRIDTAGHDKFVPVDVPQTGH